MMKSASIGKQPVCVDLLWGPDVLAGAALTMLDVLRTINALSVRRAPRSPEPLVWRWCPMVAGARVPFSLPRSQDFRGVADVVVVPGWLAHSGPHLSQLVHDATDAVNRIKQVYASGGLVAGIFNGVTLLGAANLLTQRNIAAPWLHLGTILGLCAGVHLLKGPAWANDGRIWSCDSPVLSTRVLLDLLSHTAVSELASAAAPIYLHSVKRKIVATRVAERGLIRKAPTSTVDLARLWLENHLAEPYSLEATAQAAATSSRTLLRHFSEAFGQTPLDYLHSLRIAQAEILLETSHLPIDQVGQACGYEDVNTFRRVFVRATAQLPSAYRIRNKLLANRRQPS